MVVRLLTRRSPSAVRGWHYQCAVGRAAAADGRGDEWGSVAAIGKGCGPLTEVRSSNGARQPRVGDLRSPRGSRRGEALEKCSGGGSCGGRPPVSFWRNCQGRARP